MGVRTQIMEVDKWILRYRIPSGESPHPVLLMLHGWTGDENAMWVFESRMPKDHLIIAPRGLFSTPWGGYGWHEHKSSAWPNVDDLKPALGKLLNLLTIKNFPDGDFTRLSIVGFSQGAALGYTFALLYPEKVTAVAGLSGFLPNGILPIIREHPLNNMPVFVTHGTRDQLVPVERARNGVELLEEAGGDIAYCEDDVGHKLSAECFQGLEHYFKTLRTRG